MRYAKQVDRIVDVQAREREGHKPCARCGGARSDLTRRHCGSCLLSWLWKRMTGEKTLVKKERAA